MSWLILAAVSAYILLSMEAIVECRRRKKASCGDTNCDVCGIPPRRKTRRWEKGVAQITTQGKTGHQYLFIFTPDRVLEVLDQACHFAKSNDFDFDNRNLHAVAKWLDVCLKSEARQGQGKSI